MALIMRNRPISPDATISRALAMGRSKLWLWPTTICTPPRWAASIMAAQSAMERDMGFSTSTCLPLRAAASTWARWNWWGVEI